LRLALADRHVRRNPEIKVWRDRRLQGLFYQFLIGSMDSNDSFESAEQNAKRMIGDNDSALSVEASPECGLKTLDVAPWT
jgi:hypothetical protein